MNKLTSKTLATVSAVVLAYVCSVPSSFAAGIEHVASTDQYVQHRVTVEGPNVVSPDMNELLVAQLNKAVDARLDRVAKELDAKLTEQLKSL